MRLLSLEVAGFRAFPKLVNFNLDADAVVVTGPNGTGKTSLFDAILWGLTGRIRRFGTRESDVLSLYSQSGQAQVSIGLRDASTELRISRTFDGDRSRVVVDTGERTLEGPSADVRLLELLWPAALITSDPGDVFDTALTRSVYLQQDLVRQFLESDQEARFQVVSELVGAGRLNELQQELESARNSWTRARTELEKRTQAAAKLAENLKARLERLADQDAHTTAQLEDSWSSWWQEIQTLRADVEVPQLGSGRAAGALAETLQLLQAERRSVERRRGSAESLLSEVQQRPAISPDERVELESLRSRLLGVEETIIAANERLAQARVDAAERRQRQIELREAQEELRTLASLALRHLDERCPVCQQEYDQLSTRARLEELAHAGPGELTDDLASDATKALTSEVPTLERDAATMRARINQLESVVKRMEEWEAQIAKGATDLRIATELPEIENSARELVAQCQQATDAIARLYQSGEQLAIELARASELSQREDLSTQLLTAEREYEQLERRLGAHTRTRESGSAILEALRDVGHDAVAMQVKRIEPLVERIYSRVDPHPGFTEVKLTTALYRRKGQISARVGDPHESFTDQDPLPVLSSSQLNALAVSVFLGLNLGVPALPLRAALLDDPLQSLDDVNLLGLVDALRRTKGLRQLIVSTHDPRFASLLERKLRPVGEKERTLMIKFEDWTREGPTVSQASLSPEPIDFRVAAA
ncbi:MAG: AAA family ATPase [Actinomycetota bacterium]